MVLTKSNSMLWYWNLGLIICSIVPDEIKESASLEILCQKIKLRKPDICTCHICKKHTANVGSVILSWKITKSVYCNVLEICCYFSSFLNPICHGVFLAFVVMGGGFRMPPPPSLFSWLTNGKGLLLLSTSYPPFMNKIS